MAESALSKLVGGKVKVESATLSIFEGLRLKNVRVYVDDPSKPQSLVFQAETFLVKTNPGALPKDLVYQAQTVAASAHDFQVEHGLDGPRYRLAPLGHFSK